MKTVTQSVAEELQSAARAIRRSTPETASFHREVAVLLDQIALSAPHVAMQLPPITRKALAVARAFQEPTRAADNGDPDATVPDGVEGLQHERGGNWITVPVKSCCGLLASDGCDCAADAAEVAAAFESPLRFGWSR